MNSDLWQACAGPFAQLPAKNSTVFYFPQGHAEHSDCPSASFSGVPPFVRCRVTAVEPYADPNTDEVFAKIFLVPIPFSAGDDNYNCVNGDQGERNPNGVIWCAKILTQSDANNGGGFSVPKVCADKIFPPLDFDADPPVQEIHPKDIHGGEWKFRHIYRGTPRRHLLTSGWSVFVNKKSLVAGDALIFMRNVATSEISVGIWRDKRRRRARGEARRTRPEDLAEAAALASAGRPFEVVYEPCRSRTEFLVRADVAMAGVAMAANRLREGATVQMEVEDDVDPSKKNTLIGTVIKLQEYDSTNWSCSPWRVVQVKWEGEENVSHVNPWSITVESDTAPIPDFGGQYFPAALPDNSGDPNHHNHRLEELLPASFFPSTSRDGTVGEPNSAYQNDTNNNGNNNNNGSSGVTTENNNNNNNSSNNNNKQIRLFGTVINVASPVDKTDSPPSISSSVNEHAVVAQPLTPKVNADEISSDKLTSYPKKKRNSKKVMRRSTSSSSKSVNGRKRKRDDSS